MSARTCVQPGAPAPCPRGHCGSGAGLRSYLPPELNGDSLSPPLLVRRPLSPFPSPAPSTRAASRPGCGGCAAPRPARPRRLSQAILKVSRAPAASFTLRLPGPCFRSPRGLASGSCGAQGGRCGAVRGSAGQCGACGDTALRAAWGAARPADVEVLLGPLRGPLGNCVCFPPASEKRLPVRSGTFKWAVSYLCLGAGDPAASEADSSFTVLPRGSEHSPLYLVSLPGARGPQRRGGCRVWKGPEARW